MPTTVAVAKGASPRFRPRAILIVVCRVTAVPQLPRQHMDVTGHEARQLGCKLTGDRLSQHLQCSEGQNKSKSGGAQVSISADRLDRREWRVTCGEETVVAKEFRQRRPTQPVRVAGPKVVDEVPVCCVHGAVSLGRVVVARLFGRCTDQSS